MLQQIQMVLKPFWDHTNTVTTSCPTVVESLPIYWNLNDILDDIRKGVRATFKECLEISWMPQKLGFRKWMDLLIRWMGIFFITVSCRCS
jgi:hypothetical protein